MLSFFIKDCDNCDELESLICSVECVLAKYGKNAWQNSSYMVTKPVPYIKVKMLSYYKDILINIKYNNCFYAPYTSEQIISRVKAIIGGDQCIAKREYIKKYPVTTTSTTTTTTTT